MFCDNCGAVVESDSKFCDSCGKALHLAVTGEQPITALDPTEHLGRRWVKPLLVITLSAVAAAAAVAVYEKVGESVTQHPDHGTARESTNPIASALNSVKAVIGDGTKDKQLTREAALAVANKEMSKWRGTIICPLIPSTRETAQFQRILQSTGYLTQPVLNDVDKTNQMGLTAKSKNWEVIDWTAKIPAAIPVVTEITEALSDNPKKL